MTRKKVKLAYITNDSARKATFKKRKKGFMKKVSELTTLCGIHACAIIYSPYDSQPEVWPSRMGVQSVLAEFRKRPEMEQSRKMVNQETFLRQRIAKAHEQLKKQRKENREKEMTNIMFQSLTGKGIQNLNMVDLNDLGWLIDQNMKEIHKRAEALNQEAPSTQVPTPPKMSAAAADRGRENRGPAMERAPPPPPGYDMNSDGMQMRQQWFMELMNPQEHMHMGVGVEEMMLPFADTNHNALWSNAYFP